MTLSVLPRMVLGASLFFAAHLAAAQSPRETVLAAADAIEAEFYDAGRATQLAATLRREATAGDYDRHTVASELAAALTQRLRPEDGHFQLLHQAAAARGGPPPFSPEAARRGNYGFSAVRLLPGNLGYIEVGSMLGGVDFAAAGDPARRRIDAALALIADSDAVILDLRRTPGGAPSAVGYLISAFVEPGRDVYNVFHSRGGRASEAPAQGHPAPRSAVSLYVLTSGRTASAAESIAYTLQAAGRAVVVGTPSAGGANPGRTVALPGGFSLFVSNASPRNPVTGGNWEGGGVIPDIASDADDALASAQRHALQKLLAALPDPSRRRDQQWALEQLVMRDAANFDADRLTGNYLGARVLVNEDGLQLQMQRSRYRPYRLKALDDGRFVVEGEPLWRVVFTGPADAPAEAIELHTAGGGMQRFRRGS